MHACIETITKYEAVSPVIIYQSEETTRVSILINVCMHISSYMLNTCMFFPINLIVTDLVKPSIHIHVFYIP